MPETVLLLSQEICCFGSLKMVPSFSKAKGEGEVEGEGEREGEGEALSGFRVAEMAV